METINLPTDVAAQLVQLGHAVQLCDSNGQPLGVFTPKVNPSADEFFGDWPSKEELDEIRKSDKWYSTAEVLRRLENLS